MPGDFPFVNTDRLSDLPQRSGSFQAMVRAGDSVTAYLRTGRGEPVVLLRRAALADSLWGVVLGEVSASFRAILPEKAPEGPEFDTWFRSFLDGLGLGSVRVVADAHFGMRCAETGLLDPDWLTVLVVVSNASEREAVTLALSQAATGPSDPSIATMILDGDGDDPHAIATRTVQFLKASSQTAG